MGVYIVTGPNGEKVKVNTPDGATEREAIDYARRFLDENSAPQEEDDGENSGFWRGGRNAVVRMGNRAVGLTDAYQAEQFSTLADLKDEQTEREAQRQETGEGTPWWEEILTYRPSWAAPEMTSSELRGAAAEKVQAQAKRNQNAATNYPMTPTGQQAITDLVDAGFWGGLGVIADRPFDVLSGVAQVGAEQLPNMGAALAATVATKSPAVGVSVLGLSNYSQERFGQMAEVAQRHGYNLTDREDALRAVNDPAFMEEQANRGFDRGGVITLIDTVTLGLGSKLPLNVGGVLANTALQGAGGSIGEAAAQKKTDGKITSGGEVLIEGLAEGVFVGPDVAMLAVGKTSGSQTELDAELAAEDAELAAAGEIAEQEAGLAAQTAQARRLRQAAVGFETEGEFIKARTAQLNEQNELEVDDPNTPLGQEFETILNGGNETGQPIYSEDQVKKARAAFLKKVAKERTDTGAMKADYEVVLNERAAQLEAQAEAADAQLSLGLDNPNAPTPEAQQLELPFEGKPQVATETDGALVPTEGQQVATETDGPLKLENNLPGAILMDGKEYGPETPQYQEYYGKVKPATSTKPNETEFEQQVRGALATQPAREEKPEGEKRAANRAFAEEHLGKDWETEHPDIQMRFVNSTGFYKTRATDGRSGFEHQVLKTAAEKVAETEKAAAAEEAAAEVAAAEEAAKPKSKAEKAAFTLAERELGPDWRETYPHLVGTLAAKKYSLFDREVYAAADSAEAKTPAARSVDAMSRLVANSEDFKATLSPNEQKVFDRLLAAMRESETDTVLSADGKSNATEVAKQAGVKSKSGVSMGIKRLGPKIAKFLDITPEELQASLQAGKTVSVESAVEADAPVSVFDNRDLAGAENPTTGFQTVASVGSSASEGGSKRKTSAQRKAEIAEFKKLGMTDEQIDAFYAVDDTPQADPVAEARASATTESTKKIQLTQLAATENDLRADWDNFRSKDGPRFDDLSQADKIDWMLSVAEYHDTQNSEQLDQDQRSLEQLAIAKEVEDGNATESTKPTENITRETAEGTGVLPQRNATSASGKDGSGGKADREGAAASSSVRKTGTAGAGAGAEVAVKTKTKAKLTAKEQKATVKDSAAETKPSGDVLTREQKEPKAQRLMPTSFETGKEVVADVYHGTDTDIQVFDDARLGENTGAPSAKRAWFFAAKGETASSYAETSSKKKRGLQQKRFKAVAKKFFKGDKLSTTEQQELDLMLEQAKSLDGGQAFVDDLLARVKKNPGLAVQAANTFASKLQPGPRPNVQLKRVRMKNPLVHDFKGEPLRDVTYNNLIKKAKANGHDGVVMLNTYDVAGKRKEDLTKSDLDNIFAVFDTENITDTHKKRADNSKFSRTPYAEKGSKPEAGNSTTVERLVDVSDQMYGTGGQGAEINQGAEESPTVVALGPNQAHSPIQIHETVKDAYRALGKTVPIKELKNSQAVVDPRNKAAVHFIAENIEAGAEAAVMTHEVGVHLGLENNFSHLEVLAIAETIDHWASMPESSLERTIYERAKERLVLARAFGLHESLESIEKIAYAVEEAVLAGVRPAEPDADGKVTVGHWLQSALKLFDKLVNAVFKGAKSSITPVDLVTMAHGMAIGASRKLNLEPAAELRNFTSAEADVIDYYGQREKGMGIEPDAKLGKWFKKGYEGQEEFYWGEKSTFGKRKGVSTNAIFEDGDMIFILEDKTGVLQTVQFEKIAAPDQLNDPNLWEVSLFGPNALKGKPVGFKDGDMEVVSSVSGGWYPRLNHVSPKEALRMLREARRRFTRYYNGLVPNLVWNRDTGAAFNNAMDDKVGVANDSVVRARYSRKPVPAKGEVSVRQRKGREWVKRNMGSASAKAFDALAGAATKPADNLLFLYDLVEKMEGKIPAIRTAYNAMKKMEATRNEIQLDYEQVANRAGQLAPERYALMNDFVSKSTFYQKWGYDPRKTHPELFKGREINIDPVMKNAWGRLNRDERSIVADMFAQGEKNRVRMLNLMKSLGLGGKLFTSTSSLEGPYSPLKRFGNYAAVLKSKELRDLESKLAKSQGSNTLPKKIDELKSKPDHYVVEFFDTQGAANEFAEKNNTRDGGKFFHTQAFARDHKFDNSHAPSTGVLEKLLGGLNADEKSGLDQNSKEAFRLLIREQYFSMMDERDARTSGAKRLNRAGYDKDMVRSFLYHGTAVSQMIATMEEGANVHEALAGVDRAASLDRGNLQDAFKLISEHYAETLSPEGGIWNAIQNRVATANTIMMLTSNPGYHVQNATQTLIAINKFVGDFGVHQYPRAWKELFKAYRVANRAIKGGGLVRQAATVLTAGALDLKNNVEIDNTDASMPAEYQSLVRELELHGIADVGIQEDLRQFNKFDTGFGPLNAGSDFVAGLVHRNFQAARYVEAHNRLATAIAAYELAKRNPKMLKKLGKTPTSYAVLAVQRTQGAFNALDAPLMFKKLPKLPVQYRKYQVLMGWNYARAIEMAYQGESAAMKAVGVRTLGVTLFHAALTSGLRGLPLVGGIATTALMMFGDDDDDIADEAKAHGGYDNYLEHYIRENVEDERVADLITRGVPAFFGFDLSDKIGHQNFFSVQPYTEFEMTQEGMAKWLTDAFLGPTSSTLGQGIKVFDEFVNNGDYWRSLEQALPKGQRQMMESWRLSTEGMTFKNREAMVDPREFDLRSLLANALGLPATQINKIKWNRSQQYEIKEYFKERTGKMQDEYHRAYRAGDRDKMSELRAEWREVQKAKTRLRPFFNGDPTALRRAPVSDLVRIPRSRRKKASKDRRRLGTN